MGTRAELHEKLCTLLGSRNVYYQPPSNLQMTYPAIVYNRSDFNNGYADNIAYFQTIKYNLTVIDNRPDNAVIGKLSKERYCVYTGQQIIDNMYHDRFTIEY